MLPTDHFLAGFNRFTYGIPNFVFLTLHSVQLWIKMAVLEHIYVRCEKRTDFDWTD